MKNDVTTNRLNDILKKTAPEKAEEYLEQFTERDDPDKPFATYMRKLLKEKGITQQEVFIAADLSDSYGYKFTPPRHQVVECYDYLRREIPCRYLMIGY